MKPTTRPIGNENFKAMETWNFKVMEVKSQTYLGYRNFKAMDGAQKTQGKFGNRTLKAQGMVTEPSRQ